MTAFKKIEDNLRKEAKNLLESGKVALVLAYAGGFDDKHPVPYAAKTAADADRLVFNEYCTHNMARYLTRYPLGTKIAVAVKGTDSRAVVQLIQEGKIRRDDLVILGIPATGMKNGQHRQSRDPRCPAGRRNPRGQGGVLLRGPGGPGGHGQGRPLGLLEEGVRAVHPLLRLSKGLSDVLLRPLLHGCQPSALGRQVPHR
jgi:hypothetical protein